MRNFLYIVVACCLLLTGCKHKPTPEELAAARADSIDSVIKNIKQGFSVTDLFSLPDVKWTVLTKPGLLGSDTLVLAAVIGDKVCLTNIYRMDGEWENVKDEAVDNISANNISLQKKDISSLAEVTEVKMGDVKDVAASLTRERDEGNQRIRNFIVKFYSSSENEQKKMLTNSARKHLSSAVSYDFRINGGFSGMGGIGDIYPQTIKIESIDKNSGCVVFTQEVSVVGFQAGEIVYSNQERERYSLWLKSENSSFLVDDLEVPYASQRLSEY